MVDEYGTIKSIKITIKKSIVVERRIIEGMN
jgi:hypothetical protein